MNYNNDSRSNTGTKYSLICTNPSTYSHNKDFKVRVLEVEDGY